MLEPKRSKAIRKLFADASNSSTRPVLNHADLRLKNVIADAEGKILALIDWEGCVSNIPAWELSLALHDLGVDGMQSFLEGYGISPRKLENSMPLIRAFNITNYTSAIEVAAKDKKVLEHYRLRLKGMFDLFSI
jgi:hygromycin-B 4-O-kinase